MSRPLNFQSRGVLPGLCLLFGVHCSLVASDGGTMYPITLDYEKWGYMNGNGKQVLACQYDNVSPPTEGLGLVSVDNRAGFADRAGRIRIAPVYEDAEPFADGRAVVKLKDRFGYIDTGGRLAIPAKYSVARSFSDGLALVKYGDAHVYIDRSGKEVFRSPFSSRHGRFHDGCAVGLLNGASVTIDKTGKRLGKARHGTHLSHFSEKLCPILVDGLIGYMDTHCEVVIEPMFDAGHIFSEGRAAVQREGKWGFIDKTGTLVIQPQFAAVGPFREGLASVGIFENDDSDKVQNADAEQEQERAVSRAKAFGYIDRSGKFRIAASYESAGDFRDGLALVSREGRFTYVNTKGKKIWESPVFQEK